MGRAGAVDAGTQGSSNPGEHMSWGRRSCLWMLLYSEDLPVPLLPFLTLLPKLGLWFPSLALGGAWRAHLPTSTRNVELVVCPTGKGLKGAPVLVPH